MTQFEYLSVFISIVLAFGVADILSSWGEQIRLRREIEPYWLHFAWSVLILLFMVQAWWASWQLHEIADWGFSFYLIQIAPYLLLAPIAYVSTPGLSEAKSDIKHYYYDNAPWFFGLWAGYIVALMVATNNVGTPLTDRSNIIRITGMLLVIALAVWKNEMLHKVGVVFGYLLLAIWIGRMFILT